MPWHWHEDFEDESSALENSEELQFFLWRLEQDLPLEQPSEPCVTDDQCPEEDVF
jgi:hypothetical protein